MTTAVGTVDGLLAGRYRLTERLAGGGTGGVWRALDVLLEVAATQLLAPIAASPDEPRLRQRSAVGRHRAVASRATSLRGQRQAVRATAVLLALLAVGLSLTGTWDAAATVPSLPVGTPEARAIAIVVDAGLEPVTEQATSSSVPRGRLLSVRPAGGTELERGDEVVLVVSSGLPPVRRRAAEGVPENGVDRDSPGPGEESGSSRGKGP